MKKLNPKKLIMASVVAKICTSGVYLIAADHAASEITDVYAFQSPTNAK